MSRIEWCALAAGASIAAGFFLHQWHAPALIYDAGQYSKMGRAIVEHGLFSRFTASALRTYGYPVFLSLIYLAAGWVRAPFLVALFVVQFGLFVTAALALRNALVPISPHVARVAFCGIVTNVYALLYAPECLTESLSLSLLLITSAIWLEAYRAERCQAFLVVGSLVAGFSVLVRPANLFILAAWAIGAAVVGWRRRAGATRPAWAVAVVIAAMMLPSLPQLMYNGLRFGRWTPLVAQNLGTMQQVWGIRDIKYATALDPIPEPRVHYVNPFVGNTWVNEDAPLQWYFYNPGRGALTVALHTFNLTDQDLLFTYSRDLNPWYRIPLGIFNHAVVALGLLGLALGGFRLRRSVNQQACDAYLLLVVVLGACWAVHALTAVEMRFGLPILAIMFPLAIGAAFDMASQRRVAVIVAASVAVTAYTATALQLSDWVREQSPAIKAAMQSPRGPS